MDQINVQRWANSLRQFHRNHLQPPIVTDVCVGSPNGVRNASTIMKIREYESINDNQKYSFVPKEKRNCMSEDTNHQQFHTFDMSRKDDETLQSLSIIQHSNNPSSDLHDIDTLSDAGTYIIEDDESEQKFNPSISSSPFNRTQHRHGTFDIHGLIASTAHTIHRPVVDANIPQKDFSSSSTDSSLLSFNEDEEIKSSTQTHCSIPLKQSQIKPAESFVISPVFETKSFPITNLSRRKIDIQWKSKSTVKESNLLRKSSPRSSIRPHTVIHDPTSSFQRQTSTMNGNETMLNLTKTYTNKSFQSRQQRSNVTPFKSIPSAITNSNSQTNRAVELRRARAQAKIEELAQRAKTQLYKPNQHTDTMSASWHSNASSTHKKDLRSRTKPTPQKEDFSVTRTLSSTSPNSIEQMHANAYSIDEERRDSLRDDGQRLTIKLIQLSSGILEKLKPNDLISVHELEQLIDQLQTVNRTLTSIDAVLTGSNNDDTFV